MNFRPISTDIKVDMPPEKSSIIKVIGVGGGGGNAVTYMYEKGIKGVDFFIANTDSQALEKSTVPNKIHLGSILSEGLGAGSDPEMGKQCALESKKHIQEALETNTKMLFITAGMGGGTGTGAAPVIAEIARGMGILTVAIVTTPFRSEGPLRNKQAETGLKELRPHVDALLLITNDRILQMYHNLRYSEAFSKADDVLCTAAKGIAEIITVAGKMNVDFRDVKTAMTNSGRAIMGTGISFDDDRALAASQKALESPLLDNTNIEGAKHILLNISYEKSEPYAQEIETILDFFQNAAGQNAILKFGITEAQGLDNALSVTVIATGFEKTTGHMSPEDTDAEEDTKFLLDDEHEAPIEFSFEEVYPSDPPTSVPPTAATPPIFTPPTDLFGTPVYKTPNEELIQAFNPKPPSPPPPPSSVNNSPPAFVPQMPYFQPVKQMEEQGSLLSSNNLQVPAYQRLGVDIEVDVKIENSHKLLLKMDDEDELRFKETGNKFLHKNAD